MRFGNLVFFRNNLKRLSGMITGYVSPYRDPKLPPKRVEGDISLGDDLFASTRIGNKRTNQEDAVLIMRNGDDPKYKMMVVADGVGGSELGERASDLCVNYLREWFKSLNVEDFKEEDLLMRKFQRKLDKINTDINEIGSSAETTLVAVIVADKHTYIINIGDSRAYMISGKEFIQVSNDDSLAQLYYNNGAIETRDDMRFSMVSNIITNSLGGERVNITPNINVVANNAYDAILLFSDGVTDCLSDDQIYAVSRRTNPKKLAQKIVEKALKTKSVRKAKSTDQITFSNVIEPGKDNTTAAVMLNKKKGRRTR